MIKKKGTKNMQRKGNIKIPDKRYGYTYGSFPMWLCWLFICSWRGHKHLDLGDPCYCGSDNCSICKNCYIESHD